MENIKLKGYKDSWYLVADTIRNGVHYFMFESEKWGEMTGSVICIKVDGEFMPVYQTCDSLYGAIMDIENYGLLQKM